MPARARVHTPAQAVEAVIDAAHDGLLCVDSDGIVTYINPAAKHLLSIAEDPIGLPASALGCEVIEHHLSRMLAGQRAPQGRTTVSIADRSLVLSFWRTRSPKLIAVSVRDDSDAAGRRHRAEAVLDATTDGLMVLDPMDRITYLNDETARLLKRTPKQLVGTTVSLDALLGVTSSTAESVRCADIKRCSKADCPAYSSADYRCWLMSGTLCENDPQPFAEKRCRCERCIVRRTNADSFDPFGPDDYSQIELGTNGDRLVVQVRVTAVSDDEGHYAGRVVSLRDVTSEHEIAQMKNEFVSTVSHELRTPLTSIKGYVDLILDGDAGEINEIQHEFLGIVKENSDRLVELINDMLDISRIESGRIHFKVQPLDIGDLIVGAVDTFRAVLAQNGRTVDVRIPEGLPAIAADPDRVGQVLINYISNALKYSPGGGKVTVSAKHVDDMVVVSVRDRGLGISREDQKRLFTKFYRVDSALTRNIGGTGLGLSICKSIIELLGGETGVKSKIGDGSTFWFSLPVAPPEMIRIPRITAPIKVGAHVLVVDSDEEIAALIETYLIRSGYIVTKAHTAEEALSEAVRIKPDAITLDVILEGSDGFELLQRFKEHPETADTPVIVLSIVCDEGRSCRFGAANYIEKPINQTHLISVVDGLVGEHESPLALVVDDDRNIVSLLSETLLKRGFAVATARDGVEALAAIEQRHPDVILLDLKMPKMDGYEVLRRVKGTPEWADIPVVVMTAHAIDSAQVDLLNLTQGRFAKPLSPADIAACVDSVLSAGRDEVAS